MTVEFEESLYRFVTAADFLGAIGTVRATSSNEEENIVYSITTSDGKPNNPNQNKAALNLIYFKGSSASSVTINPSTGEITNVNYLQNGANYFVVKAEGVSSGATAQANVSYKTVL